VKRDPYRFALTSEVHEAKTGRPLTATTIRKARSARQATTLPYRAPYSIHSRESPFQNCYTSSVTDRVRPAESIRNAVAILLGALLAVSMSFEAAAAANSASDSPSPIELVRTAVANEAAAANDDSAKHMFRSRKQTAQGSQTRLYVETREAMAGMTIAYNDQPLNSEQMQAEEERVAAPAGNPEQLRRKQAQQKEEAEHTLRIVKALPDAFLYDYDPEESATAILGKDGNRLVRLKFRPNPEYHPPSRVEDVLVGMQGVVVIDPVAKRIAVIDGTLFKEVSFGWGILGHLDKGGHFLVEQCDVGDGSWDVSRMSLNFAGKVLFFKTIAIRSDEVFSDFRSVPSDTTFAQGVEMLKAEELKLAQTHAEATKAESRPH
jgi:hypothetical protein